MTNLELFRADLDMQKPRTVQCALQINAQTPPAPASVIGFRDNNKIKTSTIIRQGLCFVDFVIHGD